MQRTGTNGRKRIIFEVVCIALIFILVLIDQLTKLHFSSTLKVGEETSVIDGFFYFTHVLNKGAAWSFLSGVSWAQTFFKVLTVLALVVFGFFFWFSSKKKYNWLKVALSFAIAGTVGNFIDRLVYGHVIDFLGFIFGEYRFPVFNMADSFLVVGVIMIMIHLLFLDNNAIFKRKNANEKTDNN